LAICVQHLSSDALAEFLDIMLAKHPSEVVERKGRESYHLDFGTLSQVAYADAKDIIKKAFGDDDETDTKLRERAASVKVEPLEISDAGTSSTGTTPDYNDSVGETPMQRPASAGRSVSPMLKVERTPAVQEITSRNPTSPGDKSRTKKASSKTSDHPVATVNDRYYNGERIWRHVSDDRKFTFHGVGVVLLSHRTETKRPWKCLVCDKHFLSKDKVMNHVQQHSGEKLHECPTCKGKFSSKYYLKEHQKRVHLFHCHKCDAVFDSFNELHEHAENKHMSEFTSSSCICKKGCNNSRCGCFKNGLNCNPMCECVNCNNQGDSNAGTIAKKSRMETFPQDASVTG